MPKISKYPEAEVPLTGDEFTVVVQDGRTKRVTLTNFGTGFGGFTPPLGSGPVTVTGGVLDTAAAGTTGTGDYVREDSPTLITPIWTGIANGGSLELTGRLRIPSTLGIAGDYAAWFGGFSGAGSLDIGAPILGNGNNSYPSPWGNSGYIEFDLLASSDRILDASDVTYAFTRFYNHSTPGTISLPANVPNSGENGAYWRDFWNDGDATLTFEVDGGSGSTVDVLAGKTARLWIVGDSVIEIGEGLPALGTAGQVLRVNSGATAAEWQTFAGASIVNVMDYYDVADGGATFNLGGVSVTTKNVANAFQAAYEDKIVTGQAYTLWLPPAADYGVTAYSWKEPLTWQVNEDNDNVAGFEIVGSGFASAIIPDSSAALDDKLYVAGGGPDCLSMLFSYRRMFWVGNEDATGGNDCISVLRTAVDMDVLVEDCVFYSVQSSSATSGVVHFDTMGGVMNRCYFHGCGNDNNGAVVYVSSGCFGANFYHTQWYAWEKGTNPFGGTHYDKGADTGNHYEVIVVGGGNLQTASRVHFESCTWANGGCFGAVKCEPGGGGTFLIDTVTFRNCIVYGNTQSTLVCVANVRHATLEECSISHNDGGVPTIDMQASTCERLSIIRTEFSHADLDIHADNSQLLVEIIASEGGTYKVDGAATFTVDAASTWHGLTSATAAPAARRPVTDITKSDATDLTLTATQYAHPRLNFTGTPGGAFNVIGPNAADTEFWIINQTNQALTIKKSGGTGFAIAANKTAKAWHNGTDYMRLTADA